MLRRQKQVSRGTRDSIFTRARTPLFLLASGAIFLLVYKFSRPKAIGFVSWEGLAHSDEEAFKSLKGWLIMVIEGISTSESGTQTITPSPSSPEKESPKLSFTPSSDFPGSNATHLMTPIDKERGSVVPGDDLIRCTFEKPCIRNGHWYWADEDGEHMGDYIAE